MKRERVCLWGLLADDVVSSVVGVLLALLLGIAWALTWGQG